MENAVVKTSLVLALFVTGAGGQTAGNWTFKSLQTSPSVRYLHTMVYDTTRSQVVMFGGSVYSGYTNGGQGAGCIFCYVTVNDTWVWDGASWTRKSPLTSPRERAYHAMAYDAAHNQAVVFGGSPTGFTLANLDDTWVWDGSNWGQIYPPTRPQPRMGHAMAYDAAHRQVVMFGGVAYDGSNAVYLNETWVWNGADWTQKFPQTSPPGRYLHAMAYDSGHAQVVLFGGVTASAALGDTWVWDGANWTRKSPQTSPPAQSRNGIAYDASHGQVVLTVQAAGNPPATGTWVWDGSNWSQQSPRTSPPARIDTAMAYDSAHAQVVMWGGAINTSYTDGSVPTLSSDTWVWDGGTAAPLPTISGVASAGAFGGSSAAAPGSWIEIYGTNLASTTRSWAGTDFNGNNAPTTLDGVQVTIGSQKAFLDYISSSPGQINAQVPSNVGLGVMQLTVTNASGTSAPVNLTVNATQPGLLASASFKIGGNQYMVAQLSDGTYVLPAGAIAGVASRPARPGETIVIYGIGFGAQVPNTPAGQIVTVTNQLSAPLQIMFGQTPAQPASYAGLEPGYIGLYQFNVVVPLVADSDLVPFTFTLGGVAGTQTLFTAVHQ